jgi:hypothetical protein
VGVLQAGLKTVGKVLGRAEIDCAALGDTGRGLGLVVGRALEGEIGFG